MTPVAAVKKRRKFDLKTFLSSINGVMVTIWESEEAISAFAGDDISVAKYYDFDKDFLIELEPCSTHYEMYDQ